MDKKTLSQWFHEKIPGLAWALPFWIMVFFLMAWVSPKIPNPGEASQLFWSTSYLAVLSCIVLVGTTLYVIDKWIQIIASFPVLFGMTLIYAAMINYANQLLSISVLSALIIDLGLLGIACHVGMIVAKGVSERSYLVPLSLVASIMDVWSVWGGPSKMIVENPQSHNYFLLLYPLLGTQQIYPTIGLGDITFMALYLGVVPQYQLKQRQTSWALVAAIFTVYLLSVLSGKALPAIPFISTAFLMVNWKLLEFKKKELQTTFFFIIIFLAILILVAQFNK
jgi:uncharacterized membrane protein